jgi:tetratricopeptide (TPR) repeat protein
MTRILTAVLVATLLVASSLVANAAPRSPAAPAPIAQVDHYEAAKRLFARGAYADALEELRRAMSIAPRPEVLYSMAQTQRLLGDCASAIGSYRAFLAGQPGEPFAEYARLNIERCEQHGSETPQHAETAAWYRNTAGDALVVGGLAAGVVGTLVWRSGRNAANRLSDAPDYQSFLERRAAASSAVTKQWIGGAAMITGGAAIIGGLISYVHHGRSSRHAASLAIAIGGDGAMVTGHAAF